MRRMLPLLLIAFTLMTLTAPRAEAQDGLQPTIHALREVEIMNAGLLTINDTLTLEAPQGAQIPVASIKVGFNSFFTSERRSFQVWGEEGWQPLGFEETDLGDPRFSGYELRLPSPVVLDGVRNVKIRASYIFVNRVSWAAGGYSARIPVYPAAPYNLSSFVLHVTLPEGAELMKVDSPLAFTNSSADGLWTLGHEAEALTPLQNENVTITYTPAPEDEYLLECELLQRGFTIQTGSLRLEDTYVVINRGTAIRWLHLKLPPEASNIGAHDGVGSLLAVHEEPEEEEAPIDLYVQPRQPLSQWDRWRITVEYSIPRRGHIEGEGGRQILTYPVHGFPHYVRNLQVVATLPEGGRLIASDPDATSVEKVSAFTKQAVIDFGGVMPSERPEVSVEYDQFILWAIFRPLEWALIATGFVASLYVLRRRRRVEEEKPVEAKPSELEDFLALYRERVALLAELESLERRVERKEIGREHFDRRSAEITRRQRELLERLRRLGRRIEAADPRISGRIREFREAETELERVGTDLRNLEVRRRTRRVSRRDYQRRRGGYLKRRSRARRRLEQVIAALQAEA